MAKVKFDGVVQAVRYQRDGQVEWVRAYLRRGPTFSDYILINRQTLIEYLKSGKRYYAGERIPLMASTFHLYQPLRVIQQDGKEILVTGDLVTSQDRLDGVPIL